MLFSELPLSIQERLTAERKTLHLKNHQDPYNVVAYNAEGTRYFRARRCVRSWRDDKGHSMPFGGGTYWTISYGPVQFRAVKTPVGTADYELCDGKPYRLTKDGTAIPPKVATKAEVMKILKELNIFKM